MMKRAALPLVALAAGVMAQDTTTITYSVCPTATTTTTTLSTTITYCPGASCNVNPGTATTTTKPTITSKPSWPGHWGDDSYTSTVLAITFTGKDGKVTELNEYVTVYPAPCPNGPGMCGATYTITEECPCTATHDHGWVHPDFTTTVHKCDRCGPHGEPTTITQTIPCSTGAYAHVTPTYGPWKPQKPDDDEDVAGAHGKPGWGGDDDQDVAGAHGKPQGGSGGAGGAGGAGGWGKPDSPVADASAAPAGGDWAKPSGGAPVAPAQGGGSGGGKTGPDGKPVADYKGAGSKATVAVSSLFAVAVGALAVML